MYRYPTTGHFAGSLGPVCLDAIRGTLRLGMWPGGPRGNSALYNSALAAVSRRSVASRHALRQEDIVGEFLSSPV